MTYWYQVESWGNDTYKLPKKYIDGIMISFSKSVDTDTMFGYGRIWAKKVNFV